MLVRRMNFKILDPNLIKKIEETSKIWKENQDTDRFFPDKKKKDEEGFKLIFDQEVKKIKSNDEKSK